ncbi:hypothetical protein ONE63_003598 [Megalurothrips usitatus]|uniref:MIB/HERC2 domain-containing protein n=1 Tax=Megalurothrips usitatus TaxID=439358 RepID=A0AAV7X6Z4_9NEOP|nr:hypothetical protein ONE63_003598 [Megalurothrips usitatus]
MIYKTCFDRCCLTPGLVSNGIESSVKVCSRVVRGPNWRWDNQDGGPGVEGRVLKVKNTGWVTVEWPSGYENDYRMGAEGAHDLRVLDDDDSVPPTFSRRCGIAVMAAT